MTEFPKIVCRCPGYRFPHRKGSAACHANEHGMHAVYDDDFGVGMCECECPECKRHATGQYADMADFWRSRAEEDSERILDNRERME